MREKLEAVSSEVCKVSKLHETEAAQRQNFLLGLQQYGFQIQKGISVLLQVAQEANVRNDTSLDNMANSLNEASPALNSADPTEKDESVQYDVSLVRDQIEKRDVAGLRTEDGEPITMQGNHLFEEDQCLCRELPLLLTALVSLNGKCIDSDRILPPRLPSDEPRAHEEPQVRRPLPLTLSLLSLLKTYYSCHSVMEQALVAYKPLESRNDERFLKQIGSTFANVQAELQQKSSTLLSGSISRVVSKIAGVEISNKVDHILGSSTGTAIAWSCVKMVLDVSKVCSTSCCNISEK